MAIDLENLLTFLKRTSVSTGEYNFVSLRGGKYNITSENRQEFLDLYCQAVPFFTENNSPSLVWKTPQYDYLPLI